MDTSMRFFAKLRSVAVLLETESANLKQAASQNCDSDEETTETGAAQALHELHTEVRGLKKRIQNQVSAQKDGSTELRKFIKTCMILKQRTTEDIEQIQKHYAKYGYKPQKALAKSEVQAQKEADIKSSSDNEADRDSSELMAEDEEEDARECETPEKMPPPVVDQMRTPQLSDFGLSAHHLQMVLSDAKLSENVMLPPPASPAAALTPPPPVMTTQENEPKTPRCFLRMDEDVLTPRLEDFGITENTVCFNHDFTMELFRKKSLTDKEPHSRAQKVEQIPKNTPTSPCGAPERLSIDSMKSPEVPVFTSLELNIKPPCSSSVRTNGATDSQCSNFPNNVVTPELPVLETPYNNELLSTRKELNCNEKDITEAVRSMVDLSNWSTLTLSEMPQTPVSLCPKEETTPEMPKLQPLYGCYLPFITGGNQSVSTEHPGPMLLDNEKSTQEWCLATPRVRMEFEREPCTPEMPDLASITMDILKLVPQDNRKQISKAAVQQSTKAGIKTLALEKENRAQSVAQVSEREFQALASYMKQIPLSSLNEAIRKINQVIEERCRGNDHSSKEFHMDDLRKVLDVESQASIYSLCLVELKRLEKVQGFGRNATFRILTNH